MIETLAVLIFVSAYEGPDESDWYRSLKMPDAPVTSCCGAADAYYADKVEPCAPSDPSNCVLIAIVTDTRPDERILQDGTKLHRTPQPVGTRVPIPMSKIRRNPENNPTDHNIVFFKDTDTIGRVVYCWEPASGI